MMESSWKSALKRTVSPATAGMLALAAAVVMALAPIAPASAQEPSRDDGLMAAQPDAVSAQASSRSDGSTVEIESEGQRVYQATGVTWTYDLDELKSATGYIEDWKMEVASTTGPGSVRVEPASADSARFSITAESAGEVTLTCIESWTEEASAWDYENGERIYSTTPKSATHSFTIDVRSLDNLSGPISSAVTGDSSSKLVTVNIDGYPVGGDVAVKRDRAKNGGSYINSTDEGRVTLYVYGLGTHDIELEACGKTIPCQVVLRQLKLKKTAAVKNTGSVISCPGQKSALKVTLTGVKKPKVKWSSTNAKVARVSKKGVVKAKGKGRCYVKAKVDGATLKVLVEVTSKSGCQAVKNGFSDMRKKLTYSQPNRMSAQCRDCSSFVSRCYWDDSLGRRIALIGEGAAQWAYTAAGQAQWLNDHGKRVAWKACSAKKLRPGDTVYFETDYRGKDASQWRYIDHAALYVGNGLLLNTGGYGGKGTIGLRQYWAKDSSVKFIGRPCA